MHADTSALTIACACRYENWWQAAIGAGAHGVSITSYNEFGEGTQIEPVQPWTDAATGTAYQDYGEGGPHLYMELTKKFASEFKEKLRGSRPQQGQEEQAAADRSGEL
jgi:glycoprotein endo-alpha-1,2-mannosidase